MKIRDVKEILGRRFPETKNWPGREAEIMVLAKICFKEEEVIARIINPTPEYLELIQEQQQAIEMYDPEARIELQIEQEKLERDVNNSIETQKNIEKNEKEELVDYLERNDFNLSRNDRIVFYQHCKNLTEFYELIDTKKFKELLRETQRDLEEQEIARERLIENRGEELPRHIKVIDNPDWEIEQEKRKEAEEVDKLEREVRRRIEAHIGKENKGEAEKAVDILESELGKKFILNLLAEAQKKLENEEDKENK